MKVYRFDYFLAKKADKDQKTTLQISRELRSHLGLSPQSYSRLRNTKYSKGLRLTSHLLSISFFLNCQMDDLINPSVRAEILQSKSN